MIFMSSGGFLPQVNASTLLRKLAQPPNHRCHCRWYAAQEHLLLACDLPVAWAKQEALFGIAA